MTGSQIVTIILAVITLIGGFAQAIKWGADRIARSIDATQDLAKDLGKKVDRNSDVMVANTASNTRLETKIDSIATFVHHATPGNGIPQPKKRAQTKPLAIVPTGESDDEER